ncbi:hypothetical protein [Skermanella pratensis]|uniref:hypothetical protein n=1 Tax=Skermanella pratensis TaxID=2233999 RepID=UPI00130102F1|nr:hypothetical protein [Skermanella pratensis]
MSHWMMWAIGLGLALGPAMAGGPARAAEKVPSEKSAAKRTAAASLPTEDWAVTAVSRESGEFDYCAAGTRYDNGHALLIAKNRADEVVVIVGLPEPRLNAKSLLPTKLTVDKRGARQGSGLVTRPSALAVALGKDPSFFEAVRKGNTLTIDNPEVTLSLSLRGSGAALMNLNACVQSAGKSVAKAVTVAEAPPVAVPVPVPGPGPAAAVTAGPAADPTGATGAAPTAAESPPAASPAAPAAAPRKCRPPSRKTGRKGRQPWKPRHPPPSPRR